MSNWKKSKDNYSVYAMKGRFQKYYILQQSILALLASWDIVINIITKSAIWLCHDVSWLLFSLLITYFSNRSQENEKTCEISMLHIGTDTKPDTSTKVL